MKTFTITQKILSIGATYLVKAIESDDIINTIKGKILTLTPKLEMRQGKEGDIVKVIKGNIFKTKFTIESPEGNEEATIAFPFIALFKKFTLTIGSTIYNAKGSIAAWNFTCTDESGQTMFTISKEFAFRDKFTVSLEESLPAEIIILVAVAVDQKFFTQR
ncbi:MAG: hypothetical protein JXJ04_15360 [Spirochaetales bacterium]|nr:hypothetical protein [Spirochaetales bacterium]